MQRALATGCHPKAWGPGGQAVETPVDTNGPERVAMTAAKIVLEPIFEADLLPASFGFRPKRSAIQALDVIKAEVTMCCLEERTPDRYARRRFS